MNEAQNPAPYEASRPEITDNNLLAEAFIKDVLKGADILQRYEFTDPEDAIQERDAFLKRVAKTLNGAMELKEVVFQVSGSGVIAPNLSIDEAEIEGMSSVIAISLKDKETDTLDSITVLDVNLENVTANIVPIDEDKYGVRAHFVVQDVVPESVTMEIGGFPVPIADIIVFKRYMVECSNNSIIQIPELENRRMHKEIVQQLAVHGLARSAFVRKLNGLRNAFYQADDAADTHLADMKLLKSIGEFSNAYARKGLRQSDVMSGSILDAIGRNRLLKVFTKEIHEDGVIIGTTIVGSVHNVLMPESEEDTLTPTLVLDTDDENGANVLVQIALKDIETLSF